jgi:hypothetical protein
MLKSCKICKIHAKFMQNSCKIHAKIDTKFMWN